MKLRQDLNDVQSLAKLQELRVVRARRRLASRRDTLARAAVVLETHRRAVETCEAQLAQAARWLCGAALDARLLSVALAEETRWRERLELERKALDIARGALSAAQDALAEARRDYHAAIKRNENQAERLDETRREHLRSREERGEREQQDEAVGHAAAAR